MNESGQPPIIPPQDFNFIVQPPAPKKSHKGLIATIIVLAVLLIAAITAVVFLLFFQPKDASTADDQTQTEEVNKTQASEYVKKVETALDEQLGETYPKLELVNSASAPVYKPADTNYAVIADGFGTTIAVQTDATTYDQAGQTAIQRIANETLKGESDLKITAQKDWQTTYESDDVICTVSDASSPVLVSCANVEDYATVVMQVAPFAAAYLASEQGKTYGQGVAFSSPRITQKSNGYSNAVVSIGNTESPVGGAAGLFYAKDGNWVYWTGTQSLIPCADYSTNDLQRAFENDTCYDTATNAPATVKITL